MAIKWKLEHQLPGDLDTSFAAAVAGEVPPGNEEKLACGFDPQTC